MKKSHIIYGVAVLTILVMAAGVTSTVLAADNATSSIRGAFGKFWGKSGQVLTEEQKAEVKTKMEAVKAALEAEDYTAWVAAERAINDNSPMLTKVSADNFKEYVANYKERETKMAAQKVKIDAVKAALEAGDYTAWVTAEKTVNENSPVLTKINANNFSRYVEAWKLRQQADGIMQELGVGDGNRGDMGGRGHGMPGEFGFGGPHD